MKKLNLVIDVLAAVSIPVALWFGFIYAAHGRRSRGKAHYIPFLPVGQASILKHFADTGVHFFITP